MSISKGVGVGPMAWQFTPNKQARAQFKDEEIFHPIIKKKKTINRLGLDTIRQKGSSLYIFNPNVYCTRKKMERVDRT